MTTETLTQHRCKTCTKTRETTTKRYKTTIKRYQTITETYHKFKKTQNVHEDTKTIVQRDDNKMSTKMQILYNQTQNYKEKQNNCKD